MNEKDIQDCLIMHLQGKDIDEIAIQYGIEPNGALKND